MSQPMPVVRQLYWPGLIPQCIAIALLAIVVRLCLPTLTVMDWLGVAALIYLIICRTLRGIFTRNQIRGMKAYKAQRFEEAISHFQASYDFFSTHRKMDRWRSFIFGVASQTSYRVIALGNMAYCYAQLGNGAKSIELYEQALREAPDYTLARTSLNLLKAAAATRAT